MSIAYVATALAEAVLVNLIQRTVSLGSTQPDIDHKSVTATKGEVLEIVVPS